MNPLDRVAARGGVPPFHVMQVFAAAAARRAAGQFVIDLSAGQPSTPAPAAVRAAARHALDTERIGYTSALGLEPLRAAIARHYRDAVGIDVEPANVAVTTGSSGGFLYSFLGAFDAGDTVALARPGYPAYRNMLTALGCHVLELPCGPQTRFQPTVAQLAALDEPPAGLVLASPANPTGTMIVPAELAALTAWCDEHGTRLISDEIYHGITYGQEAVSAWRTGRRAIVVDSLSNENELSDGVVPARSPSSIVVGSFSKYFAMTGWRIGWLLVPDDLMDSVDRLASNFAICPPTLSQHAALAAFDSYAELDANVARYADNRRRLIEALPSIGIDKFAPPDGAFYVYADVSRWTTDSMAFCRRLLDDTGVAVAPGIDFDPVDGGRSIRISFAGDGDELVRGIEIIGAWLRT